MFRQTLVRVSTASVIAAGLCGCSSLMENFRPTYDERSLVLGASRSTVDEQLGAPQSSTMLPDGHIQVTYKTSRISYKALQSIRRAHELAAFMSLGISELYAPAFLSEDETRLFRVSYDAEEKANSIESRCEAARIDQAWEKMTSLGFGACVNSYVGF